MFGGEPRRQAAMIVCLFFLLVPESDAAPDNSSSRFWTLAPEVGYTLATHSELGSMGGISSLWRTGQWSIVQANVSAHGQKWFNHLGDAYCGNGNVQSPYSHVVQASIQVGLAIETNQNRAWLSAGPGHTEFRNCHTHRVATGLVVEFGFMPEWNVLPGLGGRIRVNLNSQENFVTLVVVALHM